MIDFQQEAVIAAHHPSLAGHFPGNPIVPGVVLLDAVVCAFAERYPELRLAGISFVKFFQPLRPAQPFVMRFLALAGDKVRFECVRETEGTFFAQGVLLLTETKE